MSRFCGTLSLPRDVQKAATHIAKNAVDLDIVPGRSPISVAAAAIYMASQASDDKRPQREIADIAGNRLSTLYGQDYVATEEEGEEGGLLMFQKMD